MTWRNKGTIGALITLIAIGSYNIVAGPSSTRNIVGDQITTSAGNVMDVPDATDTIVGRDTADTLTNKTLTSPTVNSPRLNGSTASSSNRWTLPSAGTSTLSSALGSYDIAFDTDLGLPVYNDGISNKQFGTGSGSGGGGFTNYFDNSGFESDTTGVSRYNDEGAYVDGTGGTNVNLNFTRTTADGEVLAGSASLQITKAASVASGEGISFLSETIDPEWRGKPLTFSISHDGGSANYNGQDLEVRAYQVASSTGIIEVQAKNYTDSTRTPLILGTKAIQRFEVPTSEDTEQVRVSLHMVTDSATGSSWTLNADSVKLEARDDLLVAPIGDWTDYSGDITYQGANSVTVNYAEYKEVGDTQYIRGNLTLGTVNGDEIQISLANGRTVKTGLSLEYVGKVERNVATDTHYPALATSGDSFINVGRRSASNAESFTAKTGNSNFGTGNIIAFEAAVPIANASSNIAVGKAESFDIASILEGGTRVTSTPSKLGEWRSKYKAVNSRDYTAWTDTAPATLPTTANGIAIWSTPYDTAGTATQPEIYEIFIGFGKDGQWSVTGYESASRVGELDITYSEDGGDARGLRAGYDPSTGCVIVSAGTHTPNNTGSSFVGVALRDGNNITDGYFSLKVSDNVLGSGYEPQNRRVTKILSSNVTSNGTISDFTVTGLEVGKSYAVKGKIQFDEDGGGNDNIALEFIHNGSEISRVTRYVSSNTSAATATPSFEFVATATSLTVDASSVSNRIEGDGTRGPNGSYIQVIELNNYKEVDGF